MLSTRNVRLLSATRFLFRSYSQERPVESVTNENSNAHEHKRKCALVVGYKGTNYHGSQIQLSGTHTKTIGTEVYNALSKLGYMSQSNVGDPEKVQWTQSSRTDKGVHSAATIFSAKLELTKEQLEQKPQEFDESMLQQINTNLPEDIRVLYATRVTGGFYPRKETAVRKYEYLIPVWTLIDGTRGIAKLQHVLNGIAGTHNMHNFGVRDGKDDDASLYRTIYNIRVKQLQGPYKDFICITLNGGSFMRHQIRRIVGTALTVCNKKLDEEYMQLALRSEVEMPTHMAPSHTLILTDFMFTSPELQDQWWPVVSRQEDYVKNVLYPHVLEIERTEKDGFEKFLGEHTDYFLDFLKTNHNVDQMMEKARENVKQLQTKKEAKKQSHTEYVTHHLSELRKITREEGEVYKKKHWLWSNPKEVFHQGFIGALCERFNVLPFTRQTSQLISGLAYQISQGVLPGAAEHEIYFKYIDEFGIKDLLDKGRIAEKSRRPYVWSK